MGIERTRILELLEAGRIRADQAASLLDALHEPPAATTRPPSDASKRTQGAVKARPPARLLRISIDAHRDGRPPTNVRINVPLALARFAGRFLPEEALAELEGHHVDLHALLDALDGELPEGPLIDIDADEGNGNTARIRMEVA